MILRFVTVVTFAVSGCGFLDGVTSGQTCGAGDQCSEADDCLPCGRLCGRAESCRAPEEAFDECRFGPELMAGGDDLFLDPVSARGDARLTLSLTLLDLDDDLNLRADGLRFIGLERLGDDDTAAPLEFNLGNDEAFEAGDVSDGDGEQTASISITFLFSDLGPPQGSEIAVAVMDPSNQRRSNAVCVINDGIPLDLTTDQPSDG